MVFKSASEIAKDPLISCGHFNKTNGKCKVFNKPCEKVRVWDCPITKDVEDYITILTEKKAT